MQNLYNVVRCCPITGRDIWHTATLKECRKYLVKTLRDERRVSRYIKTTLWADKPVYNLKPGDCVKVHYGKQGYHIKHVFKLELI